ncbi:MAG: aldehyde dehydrogenase family protein, partial [Cyanobacteria bacterium]|nr:aldehyde dehydrogenase family protein [Cyanobacteriota bacterium]
METTIKPPVSEDEKLTIESVNPATKEILGEFPVMNRVHVQDAVVKAWKSYEDWRLVRFEKKARLILKLRHVIAKRADEIAQLVSNEVGKPLSEAYSAELMGPLDTCVWMADNIERLLADEMIPMTSPLLMTKQSVITYEPLGVVGLISPWNYPFSIPMMTIIMSVMVGNVVILKPSEKSTLTGIKIGELFAEAGFPEGVVEIVTGDRDTGRFLSEERLARLIFTGSVEGGQKVMAQAASQGTPVSLELGGKDAAIVLPDAPVDWTARGIVWGAFTNAGQACASIERLYLLKGKRTDKLLSKIVEHTKSLKVGPAAEQTTDVGPVIDAEQLDKIVAQVEEAKAAGATVLTGGRQLTELGGYFYEPTVITDVDHSMRIMREETFGPVLPVMTVDTEDKAIDLANDSEFGLCGTVWGKNLKRAEDIARDLDVGTVLINDCLFSHACPQLPWGGLKKSGFGRSHAKFGLLDLVNIKHISIDGAGGSNRLWWYPYGPSRVKTVRGGIQYFHGSFFSRITGMFDFIGNMYKSPKGKESN